MAVEQTGDGIAWFGEINGTWKEGFFADLYLEELMNELEDFWRMRELPPRYETPIAVPFTCAKVYKNLARPSCRYFGVCWPELAQAESFDIQEWKEQGQ